MLTALIHKNFIYTSICFQTNLKYFGKLRKRQTLYKEKLNLPLGHKKKVFIDWQISILGLEAVIIQSERYCSFTSNLDWAR